MNIIFFQTVALRLGIHPIYFTESKVLLHIYIDIYVQREQGRKSFIRIHCKKT